MTTRNLVPRGDSEGKLGISSKRWEEINSVTLKVTNLQNTSGDLLLVKGAAIEDIALDGGQLKIALDNTFLTALGFNATTGARIDFTAAGSTISADDSYLAAIDKLDVAIESFVSPTTLNTTNFAAGAIDTDLNAVSATDDTFASAKAIKTYVDAQVTAQDLDFQGDSGGALSIDLDSGTLIIAGSTGITTTGSGNTITAAIDDTAVTPAIYGDSDSVAQINIDQQGRIIGASNVDISLTSAKISDFAEVVQDVVGGQLVTNGSHIGITAVYDDDNDGAIDLSITNDGVTHDKLHDNVISGQAELAAGLEAADELLVSDNGTIKRMDTSVLQTYMQSNLTFTTNTDIDVSKANLSTRLESYTEGDTLNIGDIGKLASVVIRGNLTVEGTTTTVNSTTISVDDKNIELGSVDTPTDTTADGGGITLKGSTDKTILWENDNDAWEFSEHVVLANSKEFKIDNVAGAPVSVLSATTLGSGIINSSLTSVGTLGILNVDNIKIDGNTISSTAGEDLNIAPLAGQQIVLDDTVIIDAGVITGATSITSTTFEGDLTGDVTGNSSTATKFAATKTIGMTGDVVWTSAAFDGSDNVTGTSTIQANAVESTMLNDNIVSGLVDIDDALAITDKLIVSDAGTIKRTDLSRLSTMMAGTGLADSEDGKIDLDIDNLEALDGTGLHQTQDHFVFSDNGTEKKITFSNLEDAIFSNITIAAGDVVIAAGGAATISAGVVEYSMLANGVVLDEDNMATDSASNLATQQSIKAYVDSQVTAQDLDITSDSGTIDIDLDSETLTIAGGTGLTSAAVGTTVTLNIDSTVITETVAQTLTNKTLTSPVLNVGISGSAILDEDNMSSNSATHLSTQQSIKAYVDAQVTAQDLDFQGDSGGALSIDLDDGVLDIAGGTGIDTAGVTEGDTSTLTVSIDSTVVTLTGAQTLTNKTIDCNGTGNAISNIEVHNFNQAVIVEDSEGIASNDNDTTLPTSAAVKAYVDEQLGRHGGIFKTDTSDNALGADVEYNRDVLFDSSPLVRSHFGPFAYNLGQLITDPWPGGSDIIFYGSQSVQSSDRHFLVIGSTVENVHNKGDCLFTGASFVAGNEDLQTP